MSPSVAIAVIGGSGLYQMEALQVSDVLTINTPFGPPSGPVTIGALDGAQVAFLPRHGIGHVYSPSTVPYRANIWALRSLGVRFIIGVNACGSLRDDFAPGDIVIPDQLVDYTKHDRGNSFFETGLVGHVSVADPFSPELSAIAGQAAAAAGASVHFGGSFVIIEGPRFSTRAESHMFRALGCDIIGMTTCPEAFLAREAQIAYATMAHITDYDVWHQSEEVVTVDIVMATFGRNLELARQAIRHAVAAIDVTSDWPAHHALDSAFMTDPARIPDSLRAALRPIIGSRFDA